jgi:hypothetical protein
MAVAKCAACGPPPGKRGSYALACEPLGYPASTVICGVSGCENPALIWLSAWEAAEYRNGRCTFSLSGRLPKVRVTDPPGRVSAQAA